MDVSATHKYIRMTTRKMGLVVDSVRGKPVKQALDILRFMNRAAASEVAAVVKSAAANAEQNNHMDPDELFIAEIYANKAPTAKRWQPGPRGRANPILKRSSHITVVVRERS
jgi:large subunit ribosomal protein L22